MKMIHAPNTTNVWKLPLIRMKAWCCCCWWWWRRWWWWWSVPPMQQLLQSLWFVNSVCVRGGGGSTGSCGGIDTRSWWKWNHHHQQQRRRCIPALIMVVMVVMNALQQPMNCTTMIFTAVTAMMTGTEDVVMIRGKLQKYHRVSLIWNGPIGSERGGTMPLPNGNRAPNLFADYYFQVVLYHPRSHTSLSIPGHYATDGNAAQSSAVSGHTWICHFRPYSIGIWNYTVQFKFGINAAIAVAALPNNNTDNNNTDDTDTDTNGIITSGLFFDGQSGTITITDIIDTDDDHISNVTDIVDLKMKGPLMQRVVESVNTTSTDDNHNYYQYYFAETYEIYQAIETNPSSSSSKLMNHVFNSNDFDGYDDCTTGSSSSNTSPTNICSIDYNTHNVSEMVGRFEINNTIEVNTNILPNSIMTGTFSKFYWGTNPYTGRPKGYDSMSMLTQYMMIHGSNNILTIPIFIRYTNAARTTTTFISPFVCRKTSSPLPNNSNDHIDNNNSVVLPDPTRIDVSKVEQWNIIFDWAEMNGILIQIQLDDSSTETFFEDSDDGNGGDSCNNTTVLGVKRKLYYREMVSRLGHYLGLIWKIGSSSSSSSNDVKSLHIQERFDYLAAIDPYHHPIIGW